MYWKRYGRHVADDQAANFCTSCGEPIKGRETAAEPGLKAHPSPRSSRRRPSALAFGAVSVLALAMAGRTANWPTGRSWQW